MLKNKLSFLLVFIIFFSSVTLCQKKVEPKNLRSRYALESNREKQRSRLQAEIDRLFSANPVSVNEKEYIRLYEELKLKYIRTQNIRDKTKEFLTNHKSYSDRFIYETIELANTLYPYDFRNEIKKIFNATDDRKIFCIAAVYLKKGAGFKSDIIIKKLVTSFPDWEQDVFLSSFHSELSSARGDLPPLTDLLKHPFQEGKTIIYSFHRSDRSYPGLTVIKNAEGKFVRTEEGKIFSVPQLSLSVNKLPGFFKRGNTPQGIFSIVGYYFSPTESLGPSPIVLSRIPFEVPVEKYYHKKVTRNWNLEDYKNLLPDSWKDYYPITEAYRAGETGRRKIVMHGSADDLRYYSEQPYYPHTPSLGCLTTIEKWNPKNGKCLESDQVRLMNAFFSTKQVKGFLVVIEIDDKKAPVEFSEIKNLLLEAE